MRVRWSPAAANDLEQIGAYLKDHNPAFAQPTVRRLYQAAQSLRQFPYRGRVGNEPGLRELVTSPLPYIIAYEVSEESVHIVRVLHGAQDWTRWKPRP